MLLAKINSGTWKESLPGERLLSAELRVSRGTLRAALVRLAERNVIAIAHGRACTIKTGRRRPAKPAAVKRVALLCPDHLSHLPQFDALWVDELRTILHERGIDLSVLQSKRAYRSGSHDALRRLVASHPHDGWILLLSNHRLQHWFESQELPAVIAGSRFDSIRLPAIDMDRYAAGLHAGHMLYARGHRHVVQLFPPDPPAGILAAGSGLRMVYSPDRAPTAEFSMVQIPAPNDEACKVIDRLFRREHPPTAIICSRARIALVVHSHLHRIGRRVPQDVSLIALEWEPFLEHVVPEVACYGKSTARFAQRVARALFAKIESREFDRNIVLEPEFLPAASMGRAAT